MADFNDVIDEFNDQSRADRSVLAKSWEAFRKWVKKLFGDILEHVWEFSVAKNHSLEIFI